MPQKRLQTKAERAAKAERDAEMADLDAAGSRAKEPDHEHTQHRFMPSDLSLLESGRFADVKVTCGQTTWNLHKNIICVRCDWFNKALCGEFLEAETGTVNITEFSPGEVEVVIHYLYTGLIDITKIDASKHETLTRTWVRLWVVADFFLVDSLSKAAISLLEGHLDHEQSEVDVGRQDKVVSAIKELSDGVSATYKSWPHAKRCREIIVNFAHACTLVFSGKDEFVQLARDFRDFSSDMYIAISAGNDRCNEVMVTWGGF